MVKFKTKKTYSEYRSVNGECLDCSLDIQHRYLTVRIWKRNSVQKLKMWFLLLFVGINLISLHFNLTNLKIVIITSCISTVMFFKLCRHIREETLVAVRGVGVQLTTKYLIGLKRTFIPQEQVQRIFINEVIFQHKVIFLLTLLVSDGTKEKLVPLFLETLPRLSCLKTIYSALKHLQT